MMLFVIISSLSFVTEKFKTESVTNPRVCRNQLFKNKIALSKSIILLFNFFRKECSAEVQTLIFMERFLQRREII